MSTTDVPTAAARRGAPLHRAVARRRRLRRRQGREPRRADRRPGCRSRPASSSARRPTPRSATASGLRERLAERLDGLDVDDTAALEAAAADARAMVEREPMPAWLERRDRERLRASWRPARATPPVAVRSSATAEDTESASFAGMNETFLNVRGAERGRRRRAPLLGVAVRRAHRLLPRQARLRPGRTWTSPSSCSARSPSTRAGVMFTIDPVERRAPTGSSSRARSASARRSSRAACRPTATSSTSRRCAIVAREVRHKELVDRAARRTAARSHARARRARRPTRPVLDDDEVRAAGRARPRGSSATTARRRTPSGRSTPTATSWMLQSRPVTSTGGAAAAAPAAAQGEPLVRGLGAAPGGAQRHGAAWSPRWPTPARLAEGEVLVTHMTAPDWVPLMRRAAAIVTDSGGMTCHAAIVSRELGIPCVVGTGDATDDAARRRARDRRREPRRRARGRVAAEPVGRRPPAAAPAAAAPRRPPRRGCSSTSPSRRRSSAPRRSTSTASACCAPS